MLAQACNLPPPGASAVRQLRASYPQYHDAVPAVLAHCRGSLELAARSLRVITREVRRIIDCAEHDVGAARARHAEFKEQQRRQQQQQQQQARRGSASDPAARRSGPRNRHADAPPPVASRRARAHEEPEYLVPVPVARTPPRAPRTLEVGGVEYEVTHPAPRDGAAACYESPGPCHLTREALLLGRPRSGAVSADRRRRRRGTQPNKAGAGAGPPKRHPCGTRQQPALLWDTAGDTDTHCGIVVVPAGEALLCGNGAPKHSARGEPLLRASPASAITAQDEFLIG